MHPLIHRVVWDREMEIRREVEEAIRRRPNIDTKPAGASKQADERNAIHKTWETAVSKWFRRNQHPRSTPQTRKAPC